MHNMQAKVVHVAVGVIKNTRGEILIAKRADHAHQGGLWEFPGGKVETGERVEQALVRELEEELALTATAFEPLIQIRHDYGDKSVLLDVWLVTGFSGEPCGNEGQPIRWVPVASLGEYEFPAANQPILSAVQLPRMLMITAAETDVQQFERSLRVGLDMGARLVQLRQRKFSVEQFELCRRVCAEASAKWLVNGSVNDFVRSAADGLHLNSALLMSLSERPVPSDKLLGASCHNLTELNHAHSIGVNYICLSPVQPTRSHPETKPLGWKTFAKWVAEAKVPVYALGGLGIADLPRALAAGAQGIAGISAFQCDSKSPL